MRDAIGGAAREVQVTPPSAGAELASILRIGLGIAIGSWLYVASTARMDVSTRELLPYQALISTRPPREVRVFRELQEGLLEAEGVRSSTGAWPAPEALAADGVPPFAPDPTAGSHACQWVRIEAGTVVNYVGVPKESGAPAWLILVLEPAPGELPDQPNEDEGHHRLDDGTMLHVSTWQRADLASAGVIPVRAPQVEGWTQLYAVGPGARPSK